MGGVGKFSWFAGDMLCGEVGDADNTFSPGDVDKLDWPEIRIGMEPNMDIGRRCETKLEVAFSSDPLVALVREIAGFTCGSVNIGEGRVSSC